MCIISKDDIEATQEFRAGLVWTNVLSKYTLVVPIKSKSVADVIGGTMEALETMQAKPKIRYTDEAGSTRGADCRHLVEGEEIELYRTRGHLAFAKHIVEELKDKFLQMIDRE